MNPSVGMKPSVEQLEEWMQEFQNQPKALASVLGLSGKAQKGGGLVIEVSGVAAAVSGLVEMTHAVYNKIGPNVFQLVDSPTSEQANLKRAFRKHRGTFEEKRDDFWALLRTKNCTALATTLIVTLSRMADLGIKLVHEGVPVKNFGLVNGLIDLNTCNGTQNVRIKIGTSKKAKEIGIHGTHAQHEVIRNLNDSDKFRYFPWAIRGLHCRNLDVEAAHRREARAFGLKDENSIVVHYWTMLVLENGDTVHFDLCGPTYGVFEYMIYDAKEVPVSARKVNSDALMFFPANFVGIIGQLNKTSPNGEYVIHCKKEKAHDLPSWFGFSLLRTCLRTFNLDAVSMVFEAKYKHLWINFNSVSDIIIGGCRAAVKNCVFGTGLKTATHLNGVKGTVKQADDYGSNNEERWEVLFDRQAKAVKVKPRNLLLGFQMHEQSTQYCSVF